MQLLLAKSNRLDLPRHVVEVDGYGMLVRKLDALYTDLVDLLNFLRRSVLFILLAELVDAVALLGFV